MGPLARPRGGDGHRFGRRGGDSRAVERHAYDLTVAIGSGGSPVHDARIRDISTHGCRIEARAERLRVGAFLSIRIDDDAAVMGIVRWVRGPGAGVEFLQPLRAEGAAWQALSGDHD